MNHAIQQLIDVIGTHPQLAFWVVFAVATGEALLVVGLFVPSTAVLLGAGALVGMGRLAFAPVFIATLAGAIVGDAASYWVGRTWKGRLREVWPFSRFGGLFARSEDFFIAHGAKSVFLGRFVPGIKAMVPGIAGMSGMNPLRFTVVNIVSAVAWSIVHLVPAVMLGRGIDVARLVSPRVLELAAVLVGVALLGWLLLRIALGWMLPRLDRGRLAIVRRLAPSRDGWRGLAWRLLTNEDGTLLSFGLAALALLAAGGFLLLLLNLTLDPELARADAAISQLVQGLRTEVGDQVMVTVTMLGDGVILTSVAVALVLALLAFGEWRIGTSVAIAFSAATIFVPILKTLIHRARPALLYADAQAYSFPSGHAAMATTVLGITALVLGHQLPVRWRRAAWLATTIAVSLIAFSRIYLLAHWPSDVLAGILLGGALTMLLALLLNRQRERIPVAKISGIVTVTLLIAVQTHLYLHFARETERYAIRAPSTRLAQSDWLDQGWREIGPYRQLLDGDQGEPIAVQTDLDRDAIMAAMRGSGWTLVQSSWVDAMANATLPSRVVSLQVTALPLTNEGRLARATLVRRDPADEAARFVARVWHTGYRLDAHEILSLSVTRERVVPLAAGFGVVAAAGYAQQDIGVAVDGIVAALPGGHRLRHVEGRGVWLVTSEPSHLPTSTLSGPSFK